MRVLSGEKKHFFLNAEFLKEEMTYHIFPVNLVKMVVLQSWVSNQGLGSYQAGTLPQSYIPDPKNSFFFF